MKKTRKFSLSLFLALMMVLAMAVTAFAEGAVTYDGDAQKFIFEPGSKYSPTDLFTDFKDVMPGDSITQKVQIKNSVSNNVKIKLYMRSLGAQEDSKDFLSQLRLNVAQNGTSNLFDAPADQTAQLTDWVYLGTFYSGAEIDLNITLDVPAQLGNEYQKSIGYLDWQFKVEELPVEPDDPKPPQTGDNGLTALWLSLVAVGAACICIVFASKKKRAAKD
ncbi:MAG: hypothetical protein PUB00_02400 [Clostridiales bacterium]|nr:hypothetical protein [Clostridiales bacterium]